MQIDDKIRNLIQLANDQNTRRETNMKPDIKYKSTGKFSALMNELEKLAKEHGYDGVYVESILNEFYLTF